MDEKQLDQLLEKKIKQAKTGKFLRFSVIALLCVGLLGGSVHMAESLRRSAGNEEPPGTPSPEPTIVLPILKTPAPRISPSPTDLVPDAGDDEDPEASPAVSAAPEASPAVSAAPEAVEHIIQLVWRQEDKVPVDAVTIRVLHGETLLQKLQLNAQNNWTQRWEDSYPSEELSLTADVPTGYSAEASAEGDGFSVVLVRSESPAATPAPTPQGRHLPQTGPVIWPIPLLFAAGSGCLILSKKQARRVRR